MVFCLLPEIGFSSEKGKDDCKSIEPASKRPFFRTLNFSDANLIKIRPAPHFFEFQAQGVSYLVMRYLSQDLSKNGMPSSNEEKWCIAAVTNRPSSEVMVADTIRVEEDCRQCEKGSCESKTRVLKSGEPLKFQFENGSNIFQENPSGDLFIFQTTNEEKDLKKPYLKLNLKIENLGEKIDNYSTIQMENAKASHKVETHYEPEPIDASSGSYNLGKISSGFRACEDLNLSVKTCSIAKGQNNYSCNKQSGSKLIAPRGGVL